ncbi:MAG: ethylbenzene dehydrogenase-related protein [Alphaproteobacteria bacterium]
MRHLNTFARLVGMAAFLAAAGPEVQAAPAPALVAPKLAGTEAMIDPGGAYWAKAKPVVVEVLSQMVTTPSAPTPKVQKMTVRAVHNERYVSFLLEWDDSTKSDRLVSDQFGDQVAVELPVSYDKDNPPNPMMGAPDNWVDIMQWRAAFQRDIDAGVPGVRDFYPNAHSDLYPDKVLLPTDARSYMGAMAVESPMPHATRSPVLDHMAGGFGSLTVKPDQLVSGKGVWHNGKWRVVICRPMAPAGNLDPKLVAGGDTLVAFAVWDGGGHEVGARKGWADWVPLQLSK